MHMDEARPIGVRIWWRADTHCEATVHARIACFVLMVALAALSHADPTAEELLKELDRLAQMAGEDVTSLDRWDDLWYSLSPEMQRQIKALEDAQDAAAFPDDWDLEGADAEGALWAAERSQLMNAATLGSTRPATGAQPTGNALAAARAELERVNAAMDQAELEYRQASRALLHYRDGLSLSDPADQILAPITDALMAAKSAAQGRLGDLSPQYILLTSQLQELEARGNELPEPTPEQRFQSAFAANQAMSQKYAEIRQGEISFDLAGQTLKARIDEARNDGRDNSADQWEVELTQLADLRADWVRVQQSTANALRAELGLQFEQNRADGVVPRDAAELLQGMVDRALTSSTDDAAVQAVRDRIAMYAHGLQNNRADDFTFQDAALMYSEAFDEAFVAPNELLYDPRGSIEGNLRFWKRYSSYLYGVGVAAKDGIVDLAKLGLGAVDLTLEVDQTLFNYVVGTDIQWFGDDKIQFITDAASHLSADEIARLTGEVVGALDRRIAQNAAQGEVGISLMLSDTGYAVGTVVGAEEVAVRGVVFATSKGRVLVKGTKVDQWLKGLRLAPEPPAPGAVDDLVSGAPSSEVVPGDPFSSSGVPESLAQSDIPLPSSNSGRIPDTASSNATLRGPAATPVPWRPGLIRGQTNVKAQIGLRSNDTIGDVRTIRVGDTELTLSETYHLGGGSTSVAYLAPGRNGKVVVKLSKTAALDNYGNRILKDLLNNHLIDESRLEILDIYRQIPIEPNAEGYRVLTVMERGPDDIVKLKGAGDLSKAMVAALRNGLDELARNAVVFPDGKLDNLGLRLKPDGSYVLVILDAGSIVRVADADVARAITKALYSPPDEVIHAVENLSLDHYVAELHDYGTAVAARADDLEVAEDFLAAALQHQPGYFQDVAFPRTTAGRLAAKAFRWTRAHVFKQWMSETFDGAALFKHAIEGTGLDRFNTFGPGGVPYLPRGGKDSPALRIAYGGNQAAPTSPIRIDVPDRIDLVDSGSVAPSRPFQLAESNPVVGWNSGFAARRAVQQAARAPGNAVVLADNAGLAHLANDISLRPYIQRRFAMLGARIGLSDAEDRHALELALPPERIARILDELDAIPGLLNVEGNPERRQQSSPIGIEDRAFTPPWGLQAIGFGGAWVARLLDLQGARVTVAVVDTGVAWGHADLNARDMWVNVNEIPDNGVDDDENGYVDDIVGWSLVEGHNLPWDTDGHGTMVAGIIAAQSGNGLGIDGVNPHARIMALRALDSRGVGHAFAIAEAIVYAASNGAQVINLSLGGPVMTAVERQAIDYAEALGAVVVAAAGNEAQELLDYGPALAPAALVVGALDRTNQRLASANWGQRIDLVAPGEDILSLRAPATDMMRKFDPALAGQHIAGDDNAYYRASGTSFAAPFVSGVASLLLARSPTLKPAEVRRIIRNAARDIGVPGIDQQTGRGTLDGPAALSADPAFFIDAEIAAVSAGRNNGSLVLSVTGTADSHQFARAELSMSKDPDSGHWRDLAVLRKPVVDGELASVPASAFKGESQWTLRLLVAHRGGRHAESRFLVNLE